ncbi:hypothetical protein SOI69_09045 [Acinetobacter pittii]|uniref:hypothetical protein n=1 Tax=Acinetobacter calcoaceticus/baumannii complex TaxID=909768 RepID=UPI0004536911|nr:MULTISPECIES: hypothetical protein [Acinetobacter calcoaceticus/baumannii complex]MDC5342062.1 S1 family peptidase [Acinetobacter baumannii]OBA11013.1 hypothetical protein A9988_14540 [Acinetobacter calcoaceticus]EXI38846.1 hypothetical protein J647_1313 [Acinetobacter baumannii 846928]MDC5471042.1 S1 family peptidase [Acinetobacter baumannii]MDN8301292.1 hypothetical protein [Acinetobacter baumannii]
MSSKYKKFKLKTLSTTLFIAFTSTGVFAADSNSNQQKPVMNVAETLAFDAKHYAASYGVTLDEAMRRLLIMHGTDNQVAGLSDKYKNVISGLYFDNGPDFGLKVKVVGNNNSQQAFKLERKPDTSVKLLKNKNVQERIQVRKLANLTETEVESAYRAIERGVSAPITLIQGASNTKQQRVNHLNKSFAAVKKAYPTVEMILDNEQTGNALVYVKSLKQVDKQALERLLNVKVDLSEIPTGIRPTKTRGGSWLVTNSGSNYCMTGFTAKRVSTGELGVITAGHCIDPNVPLNYKDKDGTQYAISPVAGMYRDDTGMDLAFMKAGTTTTQQAVPEFYADATSPARALTGKRNRTSTAVKSGTVKGSYVCHLGQTSPTNPALMQSCGEVISITGANHHPGGNTYVVVTNTQSGAGTNHTSGLGTLRCVRGDSGGPWFALNVAFGIQSACSWKDTGETITNTVIYTSVDYLADIGAQLVYQ